jgi:peptide/nickel transport system substrate-binding protein
MQSNFKDIGIDSEIVKVPWALFTDQVTKVETTPDISQVFVSAVTGDPDTLLYGMYHSTPTATWQSPEHLNNPDVDKLLDAARAEVDPAKRADLYSQLNTMLVGLAPTIYAYDNQAVFAASNRVKAPTLSDESKIFGLSGMGFTFRLMQMADN